MTRPLKQRAGQLPKLKPETRRTRPNKTAPITVSPKRAAQAWGGEKLGPLSSKAKRDREIGKYTESWWARPGQSRAEFMDIANHRHLVVDKSDQLADRRPGT